MFRISYLLGKIINLLYNIEFYYFFYRKSYFWDYFCDLRPRKWRKNEAEMQKQVPQNAVLVKKHNKMIGKKWILNMDFLRIWETGAYKNKIFWREKEGFNNHITNWYPNTSNYILYTKTLAMKKTKSGHLVKVIFGQNEIWIGQNGL